MCRYGCSVRNWVFTLNESIKNCVSFLLYVGSTFLAVVISRCKLLKHAVMMV